MKLEWYWVFQVAGSSEGVFSVREDAMGCAAVPWAAELTKQNSATKMGPAHSCVPSPLSVPSPGTLLSLIHSIKQGKNYLDREFNQFMIW